MPEPTVRQMAFYWREKKAVQANKVGVEFVFSREPLFGQDEIEAWSKGQCIMKITASGFTPVGGSYTTQDIERILNQEDISVAFILGGRYFRQKAAVTNLKYDSDSEKGTTVEEIQLSCKRPKVT